jgi:hypothetical protein
MTDADTELMMKLVAHAVEHTDGHLTVCRFTTNWRVCFWTPERA